MVRRSHKQRKQFRCGHRGFGRFCHRCNPSDRSAPPITDERKSTPTRKSRTHHVWKPSNRAAKQQWQHLFAADPIDLTHLPKPIVLKTRRILAALRQGVAPSDLQGKRFNFDRTLLRIPVTYRYRLLCRWYCDRIIPLQVLTHEAYNAFARNKKRLKG